MNFEDAKDEFQTLLDQAEEFHGKRISKEWEDIIWKEFWAPQVGPQHEVSRHVG